MNRRDGVHLGPALRQLGPLTALGCSFVLGGVLGSLMVSLIAGQAAQELESFLRDYLSAAQAGEIQARFWPMLWEQGRFLIGLCILGVTALGVAGIPVLFWRADFYSPFPWPPSAGSSVRWDWRARFSCLVCRPFCGLRCCFWRDASAWRGRTPCCAGCWGTAGRRCLRAPPTGGSWRCMGWALLCV